MKNVIAKMKMKVKLSFKMAKMRKVDLMRRSNKALIF